MSGLVSLSGPTLAMFARQVAAVLQTLPAGFGQLGFVKGEAQAAVVAKHARGFSLRDAADQGGSFGE